MLKYDICLTFASKTSKSPEISDCTILRDLSAAHDSWLSIIHIFVPTLKTLLHRYNIRMEKILVNWRNTFSSEFKRPMPGHSVSFLQG